MDFLDSNKEVVTSWNGQASVADFFPAQLGKAEQQFRNPAGGAPAATTDAKQAAANLFAEIQEKGLSSQAGFKHVEKNAHKKAGAAVLGEVPLPVKKAIAPVAPKQEEVKKPPKKELKYNQWYIENYGKEVLRFEGEDI